MLASHAANQPDEEYLNDMRYLYVINHSGGKDSQAMTAWLSARIPSENLLVVHAPLGRVEWPGTIEHIKATIPTGAPFVLAPVASGKDLLQRIEERGQFPDKKRRWCTSDFKRGPIEREIRRYLKQHPEYMGHVVNCMGIRAEESPDRAKAKALTMNAKNSRAGRIWWDWLPILQWKIDEVWAAIKDAEQVPHYAYAQGMTRLSCSFCILASKRDLKTAARLRPDIYEEYVELERRIKHTLSPSRRTLQEIVGSMVDTGPANLPTSRTPADRSVRQLTLFK